MSSPVPSSTPTASPPATTARQRYADVLAVRDVRRILLLGFLVRMPVFTGSVVLTLHVVSGLGRTYGEAGLVAAVATIAIAVSGPWRGRLLDRLGLRRTVVPCILVAGACWSVAPFVPYLWLLPLAGLAGLFVVPSFAVVRQVLISSVPQDQRRTAIALDGVCVELSFMIGPAVGVWLATVADTSWVLFGVEMAGVLAGVLLWAVNPPLRRASVGVDESTHEPAPAITAWFRPGFVAVCLMATATTFVLAGSDIGIVAALRDFGQQGAIGVVLAAWGLGSLVGGLVYGGLSRSIPTWLLLGLLGAVTVPVAFARDPFTLGLLVTVAGLLCAPTITATVDAASRLVPEAARGEAMGWHGSFMTTGLALGSPAAGWAIDHHGFGAGFPRGRHRRGRAGGRRGGVPAGDGSLSFW